MVTLGGVMLRFIYYVLLHLKHCLTVNAHILKNIILNILGYKIYEQHNVILEFEPTGECSLIACTCGKNFWQKGIPHDRR